MGVIFLPGHPTVNCKIDGERNADEDIDDDDNIFCNIVVTDNEAKTALKLSLLINLFLIPAGQSV